MYVNFNLNPLTKFVSSSRSTEFKDNLPWNNFQMIAKTISISTRAIINYAMEQISNDHEDHLNQHKSNHKLCNGTGDPF